jgi:signal transduction histidine kinase/ligand-binding sensor domain-containing protein
MQRASTRHLILFFFVCLSWRWAFCQDIKFSHITPDQGLLSGNTLCVVQDYQGFFWFGSEEGLQRYDGYSFKNYFTQKDDSSSLSSSFVHQMLEDSHHNLWIATFDGGLCWYDRENDRFIRFQHDPTNKRSIIGNFIQMMFETSDGTMYVGAVGHGLSAFKIPKKITSKIEFTNYQFPETIDYATTRWAGAMVETKDLGLLVAINGVGVNRLDPKRGTFTPILHDSVGSRVQCILFDSKERLWIGSWDEGLYIIDKRNDKMIHHTAKDAPGYFNHNQFHSITEDEAGNIWLGTDNGLSLLTADSNPFSSAPFITFKHDPFDPSSLLSNPIKGVYIDKRHRMWVATYFGGINIYDKSLLQFRSFKSHGPGVHGLSHSNVFALEEDAQGNLWVGTDGGGLNFAKGPVDQIQSAGFVKIPLTRKGQLAEKIKCLKADENGNMWVGTWGDGLFRVNTKDRSSQHFPLEAFRDTRLPVNEILAIDTDSTGNLWIGTFGFGVLYYDMQNQTVRQFLEAESKGDEREVNKVNDIHVDTQGRVWVARDGGGLSLIELKEKRYTVVEAGLLTNTLTVASITEDSQRQFWLGTKSAGVIKYDPVKSTTTSYNTTSGLATNSVVATLEDKDNERIWISTNKGLTSIETTTNRLNHFTKSDGLHGNQFNNNSALRDFNSGILLFGGMEGLTAFHPKSIQVNTFNPPIVFTHFKLDNQDLAIGPDSPLKRNITLTDQIELKYFQNSFSVEFAALQYDQAQRNQYGYMLENFNNKWIDLGTDRKTTFTALPPGQYVLRVRATNNNGELMSQQATLRIVIHPAWWQTLIFKILLGTTLLLIAVLIFRARLSYLQRQRVVLRNQVIEATQEIEKKNVELVTKVTEISNQNLLLQKQRDEITTRDHEIQTQNEELTSQNEQISIHRQSLEEAHTKLKQMNNQLEELVQQRTAKLEATVQELDTVVAELDRFVYSASHDLSAPLKSILGLVNILREEKDPNQLQTYCDYIDRSIQKLDNVIRSLVEFSRNTHYPVARVDVNIHQLVREIMDELAFWPEAQLVNLHNDVALDFVVKSDPDRLKVILHNLIGNAIKYADTTKPIPAIWIESSLKDNVFGLSIKDNGIGIEEDKQVRIFEMYYRGSERSKGSGLGLFITKETVSKLKGTISMQSEYSVGTTFEIRLPA